MEYTVFVTRVLVILIIALAGLSGLGVNMAGDQSSEHSCGESDCHELTVRGVCCDADIEAFCSSSSGPCRCSCTSLPVRFPFPDAPFPHPDRETLTSIFNGSFFIVELAEPGTDFHRETARSFGLLTGLTNNEIRAILGIWRT